MDWCAMVNSIGSLPPGSECLNAPGYYSAGYFGPQERRDENSFDYYLQGLDVRGFTPTTSDGPDAKLTYTVTLSVDAGGGLDLTKLPTSVAKWFPTVKLSKTSASSVDVTISPKDTKYKSFHQTMRALSDSIKDATDGTPACTRLASFWTDLCKPNTVASVSITTAVPVITLTSHDNKDFSIEGGVSAVGDAHYKTDKKSGTEASLTSDKELSVAAVWEKYSDGDSCRGAMPHCKAPTPAPSCNGNVIKLPESRVYRITDTGFDGGGRYRTALLARPPDKEVDTLPFNNSKDRIVQGPAELFVCSKDRASDTGGCSWTCSGANWDYQFSISKGDGMGEGRAPLHITPQ
jgi:hypothetical protein